MQKRIAIFIVIFQAFNLNLAYSIDWKKLPPAIRMPEFKSDLERIGFLEATQEAFPGLFEEAADFDVNLLQILKDHQALVEKLAQNPKYIPSYQDRKLLQMVIHPVAPIVTQGSRISGKAFKTWKSQLMDSLKGLNSDKSVATGIKQQMSQNLEGLRLKWNYESERAILQSEYAPLLKLGAEKEYRSLFVSHVNAAKDVRAKLVVIAREMREQGDKGAEFSKYTEYANAASQALKSWDDFHTRYKEYTSTGYEKAQELEKQQIQLGQLYAVLKKKVEGFDGQDDTTEARQYAKNAALALSEEDLEYFSDRDVTDEALKDLSSHLNLGNLEKQFKSLVHENIKSLGGQIRSYTTQATEDVYLKEVQPWVGDLRGFVGGDCASRYSFPYPNDPHEHVFIVSGKDGERKGTVSATVVDRVTPQGGLEKALYVITVAGKKIQPGDVELIFRGLEKNKSLFGAKSILLPRRNALSNLINFQEIRGVYLHHISNKLSQASEIRYQDPDLRSVIQEHPSIYNSAKYDHMESNPLGSVLELKPLDVSDAIVTARTEWVAPLQLEPKTINEKGVIKFLLNQHALGRHEDVEDVLKSKDIQLESKERFIQATHYLENRPKNLAAVASKPLPYYTRPKGETLSHSLPVAEYEQKAKAALEQLGLSDAEIKENQRLFYSGRLRAPDAYSHENINSTAESIARDIKIHPEAPQVTWPTVGEHIEELFGAPAFQPVLKKMTANVQSEDEEKSTAAARGLMFYLTPQSHPWGQIQKHALQTLADSDIDLKQLTDLRVRLTGPVHNSLVHEKAFLDQMIDQKLRRTNFPIDTPRLSVFDFSDTLVQLQKARTNSNQTEILELKNKVVQTLLELIHTYPKSKEYPAESVVVAMCENFESLEPPLSAKEKESIYGYVGQMIAVEGYGLSTSLLPTYDILNGIKNENVRTRLVQFHAKSLDELLDKGRSGVVDWIRFAQFFEKAYQNEPYSELYKKFKSTALKKMEDGQFYFDDLQKMVDYLEGPSGAFWPQEKEIVKKEFEKQGGPDGVIAKISSLSNWYAIARSLSGTTSNLYVGNNPPSAPSPSVIRQKELLKRKFHELISVTNDINSILSVGYSLAYSESEWPDEFASIRNRMVAFSQAPKSVGETAQLINYWDVQRNDPERTKYLAELDEKYDQFLKNIDDPYEWANAVNSRATQTYRPGKESRTEILKKKLRKILYTMDPSNSNMDWIFKPNYDYANEVYRKAFPDIDQILAMKDQTKRRAYLDEHYPMLTHCTPEDVENLTKLMGEASQKGAGTNSECK